MNDIRRTILWVIFGFSMVMLWDAWQVHNGQKATFFPSSKPAATATAPTGASSVPASTVPASGAQATAALPPGAAAVAVAPAGAGTLAVPAGAVAVATGFLLGKKVAWWPV